VLAVCLPLLLLQDLARYLAFATQRQKRAVVLDSVWLGLMVVAVVVVFNLTDDRSLALLVATWAGAGAIAGLGLFVMYSPRQVQLSLAWLRFTWPFSWRFLIQYMAQQGSALGVSSEVGAIAGPTELGGVQGALLLARPFTTFQVAAATQGIAETARCADDRRCIRRHVLTSSGMATGVAALNTAFILALPSGLGKALLGDSWVHAEPLLLPMGIYIICIGVLTGPIAGMLGMKAVGKVTAINVGSAVLALGAAAVGAVINGALGAMWLAAGGQALTMIVSWAVFVIHLRQPDLTATADPPPGVASGSVS
jgi:O-antigen/teichoic acid export membrane protein